jgi:hypothetical protein
MHDPLTVAFEIKRPWPAKRSRILRNSDWRYHPPIVTIWHRDPERGGSDDSCGWFKRAHHGDAKVLDKIERAFASEWDGEYTGWFRADDGQPVLSVQATTLGLFRRAAYIYFGSSWRRANRFMRRWHSELVEFAENRTDSLSDSLTMRFGNDRKREDRIASMASCVYGWILRAERPWYRHPRWHVWHWRIQVQPLQYLKRWAFSRCATCGKGFSWGYCPCSDGWGGTGPLWFRGEKGVRHHACANQGAGQSPA